MLKLTDLTVNKELDRKAMAGVTGGMSLDSLSALFDQSTTFDFMSTNQPAVAGAATGPQTIMQGLYDNDVAVAGAGGIAFNYSDNSQSAHNTAIPTAFSVPIAIQA